MAGKLYNLILSNGVPHLEESLVVDNYIPKADLRKLVEEMREEEIATNPDYYDIGHIDATSDWRKKIEKLLEGE